jgi:hypothetical protein
MEEGDKEARLRRHIEQQDSEQQRQREDLEHTEAPHHPQPQQPPPAGDPALKHLHNVEARFYCPQMFLSLEF